MSDTAMAYLLGAVHFGVPSMSTGNCQQYMFQTKNV